MRQIINSTMVAQFLRGKSGTVYICFFLFFIFFSPRLLLKIVDASLRERTALDMNDRAG